MASKWPLRKIILGVVDLMGRVGELWLAYRLRWMRRKYLARAFQKRRQLTSIINRTSQIEAGDVLAFSCMRNEFARLPHFLAYYRNLGVRQFLIVDNGSVDGTGEYLRDQPDVSLWNTTQSYRSARFGIDWLTWLQMKHAHGHWCLTVDADEILVYPECDRLDLGALTQQLDSRGIRSYGALLLDMYPKGPLDSVAYSPGQDPFETLNWFDGDKFTRKLQSKLQNWWIQGGARARFFFSDAPERAPTMNKIPLVKWNRRYIYVSSTHSLLPRVLNGVFGNSETPLPAGALLHSKFLPGIVEKSCEEKQRKEHFANSSAYDSYYDGVIANPNLWCEDSIKYAGWEQLYEMDLIKKVSGT